MQELIHDNVEKTYPEVLKKLQETYPDAVLDGKTFKITSEIEHELVILQIGDEEIYLTVHQALDLSYALSKEAKRIGKKRRKMGI